MAASLTPKENIYTVECGAEGQAPSGSPPPKRTGSPCGRVRPARPRLPTPGGSQATGPGPWRPGSARRPLPGAHAALREWERSPAVPTLLVSRRESRATLLGARPGAACRPPASLPSPGVPQAPLCPRPVWGVAAPASRALAPGTKSRVDSCPLAAPPCGGRESLDGSCPVTWSRLPWVPQGPAGSSVTPASHTAVERLVSTVPAKQCRGDSPTQSSMASSLSQARAGATARPPTPCQ